MVKGRPAPPEETEGAASNCQKHGMVLHDRQHSGAMRNPKEKQSHPQAKVHPSPFLGGHSLGIPFVTS